MRNHRMQCSGALVCAVLGLWASTAGAWGGQPRYRYVSLDQPQLPPGFVSFGIAVPGTGALNDLGQVAGTVTDAGGNSYAALYEDGVVTALQHKLPSAGIVINGWGHVGGFVTVGGPPQAAIFRGSHVEIIPRQPGEVLSLVAALNDTDVAVVRSVGSLSESLALYANGTLTPIGPQQNLSPLVGGTASGYIDLWGLVSGTTGTDLFGDARAFRLDPFDGHATLLYPIVGDPLAWSQGINAQGDVLGYSFGAAAEHIGVWDRFGNFELYFTEGNAEFPTLSNELLFNNNNEIVITFTPNDTTSYLVPRPGIRLDLAALTENPPPWPQPFEFITGFNDQGDMVGANSDHQFLLERIEAW
jgi:hypothetical protein